MSNTILTQQNILLSTDISDKSQAIAQVARLLAAEDTISSDDWFNETRNENVSNFSVYRGVVLCYIVTKQPSLIQCNSMAVLQIPAGILWTPSERVYLVVGIIASSDEQLTMLLESWVQVIQCDIFLERLFVTDDPDLILRTLNNTPALTISGQILPGIGVSSGFAMGKTRCWRRRQRRVIDLPAQPTADSERLDSALRITNQTLLTLAEEATSHFGPDSAILFRAQAALLTDGALLSACCQLMAAGHGLAWSWNQAVDNRAHQLATMKNTLLASRAIELRDVGGHVLDLLQADDQDDLTDAEGAILLTNDLNLSDVIRLKITRIAGICTARGGPRSRTALLAGLFGLPALTGAGTALLSVSDGTLAILDGYRGRLSLGHTSTNPSDKAPHTLPSCTEGQAKMADGYRVKLYINIDRPDQTEALFQTGAEGVGLMCTESLFLEHPVAPDEETQYQAYRAMLTALDGRPLRVRALNIGGDTLPPWLKLPTEKHPLLGLRGTRLLLRRRDLLSIQMRALYRAAEHGPLSVMFPMVTTIQELQILRNTCESIRSTLSAPVMPLGITIEVPGATAIADQLARYADFFSIDTDSLSRYVLAMDQHQVLCSHADALHPAVLRFIRLVIEGAHAQGIEASAYGKLTGDPHGAMVLIGLGVDTLSMRPSDLSMVKARLRATRFDALQALVANALDADSAGAVRQLCGA